MHILVKFRDEEELQLLTANRQSGGERAVCTILYIIALQVNAAFFGAPSVSNPCSVVCSALMGCPRLATHALLITGPC